MSTTSLLRRFHRGHALIMSVVVILSAGSGLIHTVMTQTQAPPPPTRPQAALDISQALVPPASLLEGVPVDIGPLVAANMRSINHEPWWQLFFQQSPKPLWRHAKTGAFDDGADQRYAADIAQRGLGGIPVRNTKYLTAFDAEYIAIFRILPVYRFDADDVLHTRVYVSTLTGSVTRLTDDKKQWEANVFSTFHKWNFIPSKSLRDVIIIIAMVSLIVLACGGIMLFVMTQRRGHPRRAESGTDQDPGR